ncbi:SseB family protein [Arcanobacterium bovis]|uniref:SseB family protein n=1 Tax=Arcanobacterium bovis TaxID=2529275 RepID=A0A4Q9V019_9ACTO|nr:SseB family protein [Arcanobacterium bovis]TBW21993.1 SseB family protein [Arcanobacterium bovis]
MPDIDRLLAPNPFAGDDGACAETVASALRVDREFRAEQVISCLDRVFMAVFPHEHPGRTSDGSVMPHEKRPDPRSVDSQDFVLVDFPGGRQATPLFTSAQALAEFAPAARPAPLYGSELAQLAVRRSGGLIVLDPGSEHEMYLGRSAVISLAAGMEWIAPWHDPKIVEHLEKHIAHAGFAWNLSVKAQQGNIAQVRLHVPAGVGAEQVKSAIAVLLQGIETIDYVRSRLDVLEVVPIRSAE